MKRVVIAYISCLLLLLAIASPITANTGHEMEGEGKVVEGIEGWLKVTPAMSRIDFYLNDAKTDKTITDAKVKVTITMSDGKKMDKELPGTKTEETFSFMNTVDLSSKGIYSLAIVAKVQYKIGFKSYHSVKTVIFPFTYEVK
ncbi:MAG: hypothetical protein HZA15_09565 [Nitrospirae bacterium]|nr:hypothetical protein [Nitrospirota bacterium]